MTDLNSYNRLWVPRWRVKTTELLILAAGFSVLMAGISSAFDVSLIVENKLATPLNNELVVVGLAGLRITPEQLKGYTDVVVHERSEKLVCQIDDLLDNGWDDRDELAFFVDLHPHQRKNLKVEFLTTKREGGDSSAEITTTAHVVLPDVQCVALGPQPLELGIMP